MVTFCHLQYINLLWTGHRISKVKNKLCCWNIEMFTSMRIDKMLNKYKLKTRKQ